MKRTKKTESKEGHVSDSSDDLNQATKVGVKRPREINQILREDSAEENVAQVGRWNSRQRMNSQTAYTQELNKFREISDTLEIGEEFRCILTYLLAFQEHKPSAILQSAADMLAWRAITSKIYGTGPNFTNFGGIHDPDLEGLISSADCKRLMVGVVDKMSQETCELCTQHWHSTSACWILSSLRDITDEDDMAIITRFQLHLSKFLYFDWGPSQASFTKAYSVVRKAKPTWGYEGRNKLDFRKWLEELNCYENTLGRIPLTGKNVGVTQYIYSEVSRQTPIILDQDYNNKYNLNMDQDLSLQSQSLQACVQDMANKLKWAQEKANANAAAGDVHMGDPAAQARALEELEANKVPAGQGSCVKVWENFQATIKNLVEQSKATFDETQNQNQMFERYIEWLVQLQLGDPGAPSLNRDSMIVDLCKQKLKLDFEGLQDIFPQTQQGEADKGRLRTILDQMLIQMCNGCDMPGHHVGSCWMNHQMTRTVPKDDVESKQMLVRFKVHSKNKVIQKHKEAEVRLLEYRTKQAKILHAEKATQRKNALIARNEVLKKNREDELVRKTAQLAEERAIINSKN